jgi:outer membrane protein
MKNRILLTLGIACLGQTAAMADTLGVFVGAGRWDTNYSGSISKGADQIDIESDLGLSGEGQNYYFAAFEHPVPLVPNIKIKRQDLRVNAVSTLTRSVTYGGTTFNASDTVTTDLDLGHYDYILYYEVLDNWVSLDIGVDVKHFDGDVDLHTTTDRVNDDLDDMIPLLYARAQFEIPATGFSVDIEGSGISYGGNSFTDIRAALSYESDLGFFASLGYRSLDVSADNVGNLVADVTIDGAFLEAGFHF